MADGNIRFVLLGTLTEIVADKSPAGLSPAEVRAYVSTNYERFIKVLEPLVPVYSLPRPPIPETRSDRTRANVAALELLARIDGGDQVGDREAANILGQYTGWGGLSIEENSHRFPDGYEVDPYALAHEFYTPRWLADEIARVLCPIVYDLRDGRGRLNALEPSAGTGRFVDALDRGCPRASLTWTAVEMSPISSA
ncbi:MAG: hypothetical protein KC636_40210, partial [Myxococcales bacterium]|nr:hypothetical protein [Myxococcales bacterium]